MRFLLCRNKVTKPFDKHAEGNRVALVEAYEDHKSQVEPMVADKSIEKTDYNEAKKDVKGSLNAIEIRKQLLNKSTKAKEIQNATSLFQQANENLEALYNPSMTKGKGVEQTGNLMDEAFREFANRNRDQNSYEAPS